MSIRNKLIIVLLSFSFIPFLGFGLMEITREQKTLEKQLGKNSLELSCLLMRNIDRYLYDNYIDIKGWSKSNSLKGIASGDGDGSITQLLVGLSEIYDQYYYLNCLNANGQVVASSNVELKGKDMSSDAGFKEALDGNQTMQDVAFNEMAGEYAVVMSTPVWNIPEQSEVIGVLTVALKWDKVREMINEIKIEGKEQSVAAHIMLLNRDGLVISCFDKDEVFSDNLIESGIKSAINAQEHKEGYLVETSEHGLSTFSTYTYSKKYKDLPHLGWNLILEQNPEEAFAVADSSTSMIIIILSGTVAILIIVAYFFANRISKPVLAVVSAAESVGKGDLDAKVDIHSNDELGLLSSSFNKMVDSLKNSTSELSESEEQNRNVLRTALDGFWVVDVEGRIMEVNDSYCNLTGYSREELLKMSISDVETSENPEDMQRHIHHIIKVGGDRFESKHRCKDGRIVDVEISVRYVETGGGRLFAFIHDITNRKRSEKHIYAQHEVTKLLAESLTMEETSPRIIQNVCTALEWDLGEIWIFDHNDGVLHNAETWHMSSIKIEEFKAAAKHITFPAKVGLPGRVFESAEPLWMEDVVYDTSFQRASIAYKEGLHSAFGVPIIIGSEVLGSFCFFSRQIRKPDKELLDMMTAIGRQIGLFIKRKQAEEVVRFNADRFNTWKSSNFVGVLQSNTSGGVDDANDALLSMLGYSRQELIEGVLDWTSLTPPEYLHLDKKAMKEAADKGFWTPFEKEYFHKDGHRIPILIGGSLFKETPGEYIVFIIDLTEQKRMAEKFERVFNISPDMVGMGSLEGHFTQINYSFKRILGYEDKEFLGRPFIEFVHKEDVASTLAVLDEAVDGRQNLTNQNRFKCKDGSYKWIEWNFLAIAKEGVFYTTGRDITERKKMEAALLQSEKLRAMGMITSGIGHDFNNILTIISGCTQILELENEGNDVLLKTLHTISKASDDGAEIVRRMRMFTKQEKGDSVLLPVDINGVLKESIEFVKPRWMNIAKAGGIYYDIDYHDGITAAVTIVGNESELREVFINIMNNSMDAMEKGGGLAFRTWQDEENVFISISDTGEGMPEEVRAHVFEPFYTTKREKGSGLGLSMSYGIIKRHGGGIEVKSEKGKGTTFTIRLPVNVPLEHKTELSVEDQKIKAKDLRILVIDDQEALRSLLELFFTKNGHTVRAVESGNMAVEVLKTESFDFVLCDLVMPGMSGHQVVEVLNRLEKRPKIGVMTGWSEKIRTNGDHELDVDFVIMKPIKFQVLAGLINKAIGMDSRGE